MQGRMRLLRPPTSPRGLARAITLPFEQAHFVPRRIDVQNQAFARSAAMISAAIGLARHSASIWNLCYGAGSQPTGRPFADTARHRLNPLARAASVFPTLTARPDAVALNLVVPGAYSKRFFKDSSGFYRLLSVR